jgi:hypothetical protein
MAMTVCYTTIHGMLLQENRGGTETLYVADTLGSCIETRDASGAQTSSADYWPYGETQISSGSNPSPWGFVGLFGYLRDTSVSLYVRARQLRADFGRWLTVDPLWRWQGSFTYSADRPLDRRDATGLFAWIPVVCAVGIGGCLLCLAGFLGACWECRDQECWVKCVVDIWNNLPGWAKFVCAAACVVLIACLIAWLAKLAVSLWPLVRRVFLRPPCPPQYAPPAGVALCMATCLTVYISIKCSELPPDLMPECRMQAAEFCIPYCRGGGGKGQGLPVDGGGGIPSPVPDKIAA